MIKHKVNRFWIRIGILGVVSFILMSDYAIGARISKEQAFRYAVRQAKKTVRVTLIVRKDGQAVGREEAIVKIFDFSNLKKPTSTSFLTGDSGKVVLKIMPKDIRYPVQLTLQAFSVDAKRQSDRLVLSYLRAGSKPQQFPLDLKPLPPPPPPPEKLKITSGPFLPAERIGVDTARISWTTNLPAIAKVEHGTDRLSVEEGRGQVQFTALLKPGSSTYYATEHLVLIWGLQPLTEYYYRVSASNTYYGGTVTSPTLGPFKTYGEGFIIWRVQVVDGNRNPVEGAFVGWEGIKGVTEQGPPVTFVKMADNRALTNSTGFAYNSDGTIAEWSMYSHGPTLIVYRVAKGGKEVIQEDYINPGENEVEVTLADGEKMIAVFHLFEVVLQ